MMFAAFESDPGLYDGENVGGAPRGDFFKLFNRDSPRGAPPTVEHVKSDRLLGVYGVTLPDL